MNNAAVFSNVDLYHVHGLDDAAKHGICEDVSCIKVDKLIC